MKQVLVYSILLALGLVLSQTLPALIGDTYGPVGTVVRVLTMICLSFIMIHVGYEFDIDKSRLRQYGWDYVVAFTAATFPWIFVTAYFVFVLLPPELWDTVGAWKETLLAGRFAAPTSAGVLFSMLAAAGFGATWLFRKARILAIFDDLDTVLLMIPLKMLMVGLAWQLGVIVAVMVVFLGLAYVFLHRVRLPVRWPWILMYATIITGVSEVIYAGSTIIDDSVPIHIEVLLPAFVLGCTLAYPDRSGSRESVSAAESPGPHHDPGGTHAAGEHRAATTIAGVFMVLVGLSLPTILSGASAGQGGAMAPGVEPTMRAGGVPAAEASAAAVGAAQEIGRITAAQPAMDWWTIAGHVLLVTFLSNLGKMFPALCYRATAHWRERLAVAIGMWPRGEVGAGVLVISLSYGIGGPIVTVAMLSLALNLMLTGVFIYFVQRLTAPLPAYRREQKDLV